MEGKFLEQGLSYQLVGCFYTVRNLYGSGHREVFYDRVLDEVLAAEEIHFINKPRVSLHSIQTGNAISFIIPDKLIGGKILLEVKAKPFTTNDDMGQVLEYLRITEYEILYLVNFGEKYFQPKRFIYTNDRKSFLAHKSNP